MGLHGSNGNSNDYNGGARARTHRLHLEHQLLSHVCALESVHTCVRAHEARLQPRQSRAAEVPPTLLDLAIGAAPLTNKRTAHS